MEFKMATHFILARSYPKELNPPGDMVVLCQLGQINQEMDTI